MTVKTVPLKYLPDVLDVSINSLSEL